jgi:predicted DNA-binding transcriptional regulator YafY
MPYYNKRYQRLLAIEQFLRTAESTLFKDLKHFALQFGEVKERMIREDLKLLRKGFGTNDPVNIVVENGHYKIKATGSKWSYTDLAETERATLPLVFSILHPYREMPAIKKVLEDLKQEHRLANKDIKLLSAAVWNRSTELQPEFLSMTTKLMGFIAKQHACEFNYFKVSARSDKSKTPTFEEVYPLQIRIFEFRYYLVAIRTDAPLSPESLRIFPLDGIHRYRIDESVNQNTGEPNSFNWHEVSKMVELNDYFNHCIGLYRDYTKHKLPTTIIRWFKDWAASQVEAVPLHPSQVIIQRVENAICIKLNVYNTVELTSIFNKYGDFSWE